MSHFICLLSGAVLGGCITTIILCCFQINRLNDYESEIRRLRDELGMK